MEEHGKVFILRVMDCTKKMEEVMAKLTSSGKITPELMESLSKVMPGG